MTANGCIRLQNTTTGGNRCCGQGAGPAVMGWGGTTDTLLPVWGMVIKPQATGIGEAENKSGKWKVDDDFMDKGKGKKGVGGWMGVKVVLRMAYSNQNRISSTVSFF